MLLHHCLALDQVQIPPHCPVSTIIIAQACQAITLEAGLTPSSTKYFSWYGLVLDIKVQDQIQVNMWKLRMVKLHVHLPAIEIQSFAAMEKQTH